jgi:hypothetical protein
MMHSPGFHIRKIIQVGSLCFALALVAGSAQAEIKLVGSAHLSGESTDLSGLTDLLSGDIPHNRLGGISAIDYTGANDEYLLLPDRGPSDGATAYSCRVHRMHLTVTPGKLPVVTATLKATTMLVNEDGHALTGSAEAFRGTAPALWERFDPEAIRVTNAGSFYLSDEYGPSVFLFSPMGKRTAVVKIPQKFLVQHPSAKAEEEATNVSGRQPNGGMEGLAITPNGKKLYAAMQRPLIQDSSPDEKVPGKRTGTNTRLLEIDVATGTTRELLYPLDATANGISEILAINDHEFLMLERDGKPGSETIAKRIYKIDIAGATDISNREKLPASGIPDGVAAISKKLFLELLDPKFGLAGPDFPEKVEGLAFAPDLPDGRRLLIVAIDNDFVAAKPIILHAFAIDAGDLPGLVKPTFRK